MFGLKILNLVENTLGSLILKMFSTIPMFGGMVDKEDHGIPASLLSPEGGVHWEHLLSANPMAKVIGGLDGLSLLFPNHCFFSFRPACGPPPKLVFSFLGNNCLLRSA